MTDNERDAIADLVSGTGDPAILHELARRARALHNERGDLLAHLCRFHTSNRDAMRQMAGYWRDAQ